MITYQVENNLDPKEFLTVLNSSTLGERRPVDDFERIRTMVKNGNLIITARDGDKLVGVSRSVTDFAYCLYLSDLAVDEKYQKKGIGKELILRTQAEVPQANLILLSAPGAINFYEHIGMEKFPECFLLRRNATLQNK